MANDDAEAIAQQWAEEYIGRRRVDDKVMDALVLAEIAQFQGDEQGYIDASDRAYHRLSLQGYTAGSCVLLVDRLRTTARMQAERLILDDARDELDALGHTDEPEHCADPWLHHRLETQAAQEHRPPSTAKFGHCRWCSKPFERRDIP